MSKEKQMIEELADFLWRNTLIHTEDLCHDVAETIITADYRKQSEWISVDERLPDKGQDVLAYRGDFNGDMMNTYTYLGSGNWEDDYGYRGSTEHEGITHWVPLPEPPKERGTQKHEKI